MTIFHYNFRIIMRVISKKRYLIAVLPQYVMFLLSIDKISDKNLTSRSKYRSLKQIYVKSYDTEYLQSVQLLIIWFQENSRIISCIRCISVTYFRRNVGYMANSLTVTGHYFPHSGSNFFLPIDINENIDNGTEPA